MAGDGFAVLVMERSAAVCTVVLAVAALLPVLESEVAALTWAVFDRTVPAATVEFTLPTRVIVADCPLDMEPVVQCTLPVPPTGGVVQLHAEGRLIEGTVSSMATLVAVLGPLLLTTMVYVRVPPGLTGSGESVFVTARSAWLPLTAAWAAAEPAAGAAPDGTAVPNTTAATSARPVRMRRNALRLLMCRPPSGVRSIRCLPTRSERLETDDGAATSAPSGTGHLADLGGPMDRVRTARFPPQHGSGAHLVRCECARTVRLPTNPHE